MGSDCDTDMQNLTFCLVYSCPGCTISEYSPLSEGTASHIDFGIVWKCGKGLVQCFVHLCRRPLEESPTSCTIFSLLISDSGP